MPSPSKSQLNLSVDSELKAQFKALCDSSGVSLAKAFESFMANSIESQKILVSPSQSPSIESGGSPTKSPSIAEFETTIQALEDRLLGK